MGSSAAGRRSADGRLPLSRLAPIGPSAPAGQRSTDVGQFCAVRDCGTSTPRALPALPALHSQAAKSQLGGPSAWQLRVTPCKSQKASAADFPQPAAAHKLRPRALPVLKLCVIAPPQTQQTDIQPSTMSLARPHARLLSRLRLSKQQLRTYAAPGDGTVPAAKKKYIPTSGTYPLGFSAGSAHVGVKPSNTRFDDLALVASETPCSGAAVFTTNKFQAAPVTVSREIVKKRNGDGIRAVVVNSGCANAVTGRGGIEDAVAMGEQTDQCFLNDSNGEDDGNGSRTIVMSTGVIGQRYNWLRLEHTSMQLTPFQAAHKEDHRQNPRPVLHPRLITRPLARRRPRNLYHGHFPQARLEDLQASFVGNPRN